jgi:anti-sigma factor RsiW
MKREPSVEHLEDTVILAYLDGELCRAAARKAKHHLESCWNCRSAAAELELLAQTAYALLSGGNEGGTVQTGTAKAELFRRKAEIDETWDEKLRRSTSILFQRPVSSIERVPRSMYGWNHGLG